jgi:hypothetical protein
MPMLGLEDVSESLARMKMQALEPTHASPSLALTRTHHTHAQVGEQTLLTSRFHEEVVSIMPVKCKSVYLDCCAQFVTTAEAVRRTPLPVYQRLLKLVLADDLAAKSMEFFWHVLLTHRCEMDLGSSKEQYLRQHFAC